MLPPAAARLIDQQVDLDLVPAVGLTIYRNAVALPPAAILEIGDSDRAIMAATDPSAIAMWRSVRATPLRPARGGWDGPPQEGTVFVSTEHDDGWALRGGDEAPAVAFGWATSFVTEGQPVAIRHEGRLPATIQLWVLVLLWIAALWFTRKPVAR
jgi:hypothetical protein